MAACKEVSVKTDLLSVLQEYLKQQERRKSVSSIDEDGFILVVKESVWTSLFGEYFMQLGDAENTAPDHEEDDMLFYVRCNPRASEQEVIVCRVGSKNVPGLGDPHINWEETVYLNLIMHQIEYTLTCTICKRLPNRDLRVVKKASLKIYASHEERRMDSKGEESKPSYPNIFFMIDTYDEVFGSLCVRDEEMVCVELVAKYKGSDTSAVIFLGSVGYDALKKVYDSKGSFGLKLAQKMSLGWMASDRDHIEFVRMRGPHGKGFAEMAVSQYRPREQSNGRPNGEGEQRCQCSAEDVRGRKSHQQVEGCKNCGVKNENNSDPSSLGYFNWTRTRKKSSMVLGTRLTYINLPWTRIMKDLLETRQSPLFAK